MLIVQVPASSANLGPGFDCLGLAVNLHLTVRCEWSDSGLAITANEPDIPADGTNVIVRAMAAVFGAAGRELPGLTLDVSNTIPLSRGLGSSAAAIAAGLVLANGLLSGRFSNAELLDIGLPLEGHPDNLAPALFGGLQVTSLADGKVLRMPVPMPTPPRLALFIPEKAMSTHAARQVLPDGVPRQDAVFNTGRSSLLVAALATGGYGVLRQAMEDRLHQPYRASIFPQLPRLIEAALAAGAAGAALSGAGSTVVALCEGDPAPAAAAMAAVGVAGRPLTALVEMEGAHLLT